MRLTSAMFLALAFSFGTHAQEPVFDPPLQNFTQKVNHNSSDDTTFLQRYQLDTRHFRPGGPILFHQGEEEAISPLAYHVFSDYAPKLGAIIASLEHRYFGESYPSGLSVTSNITAQQYAPLTLENVLQDSIEFVRFIHKTVPGAENSKVIHSAGSYGGFLSALARIRYPETFYGSIAMSPALTNFGASTTIQENPYRFAASDWVANVYWDTNPYAAQKIRDALKELDSCAKANNCASALPGLRLCTQPASQPEWLELESIIVDQYALIPQLDYPFSAIYPANALNLLVNQTLQANSPGEVLGLPVAMAAPAKGNVTDCVNWAAISGTGSLTQTGIGASWTYITCTYFVGSESAVSPNNSLFPAWMANQSNNGCGVPEWAGPDLNKTNEEWVAKFGFTDDALDQTTRLLITHGLSDRISAIGTPRLSLSSDRNHSRVLSALGVSHGEMSYPEAVIPRGVKPQLDILRDTQLAYIHEWLGIENADASSSNATWVVSKPGSG